MQIKSRTSPTGVFRDSDNFHSQDIKLFKHFIHNGFFPIARKHFLIESDIIVLWTYVLDNGVAMLFL